MPKMEKTVLQNDSNEAENGTHKPETPEQTQENQSFCLDDHSAASRPEVLSVTDLIKTVNEISKLSIAHEIVILLSLLLPRQNSLRDEIEEALDIDLLKQEAEHGALDVPHLSNYILKLMTLLCAPVRDEAVRKLQSITDPVQLLRGIFHVLGLMKMDMVNYTIQSLRPYLKEHSILYERAKFQELLNKQPNLLDCTTKWLTKTALDLTTPPSSSPDSPSSSVVARSSPNWAVDNPQLPSSTMVLYQGYLNLLLWDLDSKEFPETLLMDRIRLRNMESQLKQLAILTSVLLVARSFSGHSAFCPSLSRPEETMVSVSEQVSQKIHERLKDMGLTALSSEKKASLRGQLQNIAKKENCVRSIIDQRIHLFLKGCLVRGMQESLLDFPVGLILIKGELTKLGWKFFNLMRHNQQVFSPYYDEILKDIIPSAQAQETEVESI
ncbi:hypothetical protein Celaphus_00009714, partial [Cervus elaphus hippelaphus]